MTELLAEFSPSAYMTDTQVSRLKWMPRFNDGLSCVLEQAGIDHRVNGDEYLLVNRLKITGGST